MCNLYSSMLSQHAMRSLFRIDADRDRLGNFEPLSAIWPKYEAPVVRLDDDGERELVRMHWGFLTPQTSKKTGKPIKPAAWNNARDDKLRNSGLWKGSFENRRCLIPATSFREAKGRRPAIDHWFSLKGEEERPPFAFAGLWRAGQPGVEGEEGAWVTHTMVTTTANEIVRPVHPTRIPVILHADDHEAWLKGSPVEAAALLRPFPAQEMRIAIKGENIHQDPTE